MVRIEVARLHYFRGCMIIPVIVLAFIFLVLLSCTADAMAPGMAWNRTFRGMEDIPDIDTGNYYGYQIIALSDGYLIAGGFENAVHPVHGGWDVYMIRTDREGNVIWRKAYGGTGDDVASSVMAVNDGYVIAGETSPYRQHRSDAFLIKTALNGDRIWNNTYCGTGTVEIYSAVAAGDGYVMAGYEVNDSRNDTDIYLIKTDPDGNFLWSRTFGGPYYEVATSVLAASDGYVIAGYTSHFNVTDPNWQLHLFEGVDGFLVKTDLDGNVVWNRTYYSARDESISDHINPVFIRSIAPAGDGYIMAGEIDSHLNKKIYLARTDREGNIIWNRTFGGAGNCLAHSVITVDDGFVIAGKIDVYYMRFIANGNVYLLKTDNDGNELWNETFGEQRNVWGHSVAEAEDGYAIVGSLSENSHLSIYLVKTNPDEVMPEPGRPTPEPAPAASPSAEVAIIVLIATAAQLILRRGK